MTATRGHGDTATRGDDAPAVPLLSICGLEVEDLRELLPSNPAGSFGPFSAREPDRIRWLVVHHTAGPATQTAEEIARFHVAERGWAGIGYHFLIPRLARGGPGIQYVGDVDTARACVLGHNHEVVCLALVGDYEQVRPTVSQMRRLRRLIVALWRLWDRRIPVVPHLALTPTLCPGRHVLARLAGINHTANAVYERNRL